MVFVVPRKPLAEALDAGKSCQHKCDVDSTHATKQEKEDSGNGNSNQIEVSKALEALPKELRTTAEHALCQTEKTAKLMQECKISSCNMLEKLERMQALLKNTAFSLRTPGKTKDGQENSRNAGNTLRDVNSNSKNPTPNHVFQTPSQSYDCVNEQTKALFDSINTLIVDVYKYVREGNTCEKAGSNRDETALEKDLQAKNEELQRIISDAEVHRKMQQEIIRCYKKEIKELKKNELNGIGEPMKDALSLSLKTPERESKASMISGNMSYGINFKDSVGDLESEALSVIDESSTRILTLDDLVFYKQGIVLKKSLGKNLTLSVPSKNSLLKSALYRSGSLSAKKFLKSARRGTRSRMDSFFSQKGDVFSDIASVSSNFQNSEVDEENSLGGKARNGKHKTSSYWRIGFIRLKDYKLSLFKDKGMSVKALTVSLRGVQLFVVKDHDIALPSCGFQLALKSPHVGSPLATFQPQTRESFYNIFDQIQDWLSSLDQPLVRHIGGILKYHDEEYICLAHESKLELFEDLEKASPRFIFLFEKLSDLVVKACPQNFGDEDVIVTNHERKILIENSGVRHLLEAKNNDEREWWIKTIQSIRNRSLNWQSLE